jgi:NAD(P)-dependent dehydrogenase (short-subunit alcohol dehydrogenase family)
MGELDGRVALVTGAGRGIGASIAEAIAEQGGHVALIDINLEAAQAVVDGIDGDKCVAVELDVSAEEDAISAGVASIVERLGPIDILVNNAAILDPEVFEGDVDFAATTKEIWERTFAVNVIGAALMAKHVVPSMMSTGRGGVILNLSSTGAFKGDVSSVAYRTSKTALEGLTRCMAASHGPYGIRCNAIAPGLILTPAAEQHSSTEHLALLGHGRLIKDIGRPRDVAELAIFLVSDRARYLTGASFMIDGGASILQSWHALRVHCESSG